MPSPPSPSRIRIGDEIQVWWPADASFYKGTITAHLPDSTRHRVLYDDGDVELLRLPDERWRFVGSALQRETQHRNSHRSLNIPPTPPVRAAAIAAMAATYNSLARPRRPSLRPKSSSPTIPDPSKNMVSNDVSNSHPASLPIHIHPVNKLAFQPLPRVRPPTPPALALPSDADDCPLPPVPRGLHSSDRPPQPLGVNNLPLHSASSSLPVSTVSPPVVPSLPIPHPPIPNTNPSPPRLLDTVKATQRDEPRVSKRPPPDEKELDSKRRKLTAPINAQATQHATHSKAPNHLDKKIASRPLQVDPPPPPDTSGSKMVQTTLIPRPPLISSLATKNAKNKRPRSVAFHDSLTATDKNSTPAPPPPPPSSSSTHTVKTVSSKQTSTTTVKAEARKPLSPFKQKTSGRVMQNAERGTASMPLDILMKTITDSNIKALEAQLSPVSLRLQTLITQNAKGIEEAHKDISKTHWMAKRFGDGQKKVEEGLVKREEFAGMLASELSRLSKSVEDMVEKKIDEASLKMREEMNNVQLAMTKALKDEMKEIHRAIDSMVCVRSKTTEATTLGRKEAPKTQASALAQATAERLSSRMAALSNAQVVKGGGTAANREMNEKAGGATGPSQTVESEVTEANRQASGGGEGVKAFSRGRVYSMHDLKSKSGALSSLQPRSAKEARSRMKAALGKCSTTREYEEGQIVERNLHCRPTNAGNLRDPGKQCKSNRKRESGGKSKGGEEEFEERAREAKHLIGKAIIEWLLKGLCREKAPESEREEPVGQEWVQQAGAECLKAIAIKLKSFAEFQQGMEAVDVRLRDVEVELGWLMDSVPTAENIAKARMNYKGWVPPLLEFEWESEKRVLLLMADCLLRAQLKLRSKLLLESDPLVIAVYLINEAAQL